MFLVLGRKALSAVFALLLVLSALAVIKAYVKTADGGEVDVDTLSDEQREKLGTWLRVTYLNELCRGKTKFHVKQ